MAVVLLLAAAYNLGWGAFTVLAPNTSFIWAGIAPPNYPEIWQAVGMIVGVYGVGYAIAATDPHRHWPIVAVGLLGKVLGPIGFALALAQGHLPLAFGWQILTNDLVWWVPFSLILLAVMRTRQRERRIMSPQIMQMALRAQTQYGTTLDELNQLSPVLLVFLRHAGCMFCREALQDLSRRRSEIEQAGTRIVLVHMGSEERGQQFFQKFGLGDAHRISDPHRALYRAFALPRGSFWDVFGPQVWLRGFEAAILSRNGVGLPVDDFSQMPGVFLMFHGHVLKSYRHQAIDDRPDYVDLIAVDDTPSAQFSL